MSNWSEELKETTRKNTFLGAVVKNEEHEYGLVMRKEPKVVIYGIQSGGVIPLPSGDVIATFDSVDAMVDAGWVLD